MGKVIKILSNGNEATELSKLQKSQENRTEAEKAAVTGSRTSESIKRSLEWAPSAALWVCGCLGSDITVLLTGSRVCSRVSIIK